MRYKITLSYDGSAFCGWQIQPDAPSVQQTLEQALGTLLGAPVKVTGAGRTDTGVNARGYAAHFDCLRADVDTGDLCYKLNAILPREIAVEDICPTTDGFHARFDAKRREYTYYLHRKKDPFAAKFSWLCTYPGLDICLMNEAARHLLGTHDFKCFEKSGGDSRTSVCTVYEAYWCESGENHWEFHIAADRFLRNMVRAIVGTLIEVGRSKRTPGSIDTLIESGTRSDSGESVPGHALFLTGIEY